MPKGINILFTDVKLFLSNEVNRLTIIVLCGFITFGFLLYKINQNITHNSTLLKTSKDEIIKRVDYRYHNTRRSLQDIDNVEIEEYKGHVLRKFQPVK